MDSMEDTEGTGTVDMAIMDTVATVTGTAMGMVMGMVTTTTTTITMTTTITRDQHRLIKTTPTWLNNQKLNKKMGLDRKMVKTWLPMNTM